MELTAEHKKKIKKIVAKADKQTMTVKTVRRTLEKSLGLEKDALKPLKEELTAYVTLLIDPPTPAKDKKAPAKKPKPESTEDARIVQLKKMGQAVRASASRSLRPLNSVGPARTACPIFFSWTMRESSVGSGLAFLAGVGGSINSVT